MEMIDVDNVLKVVKDYLTKNKMSLSEYARKAKISKSWLSKLFNGKKKQISLDIAQRLLNVSEYEFKIVKSELTISKIKRLGKINETSK